ncbi:lipoprotein [Microbispora corallina]|uniref:Lipoprotein n=1 Tax=Microbispora corallina TaxID=83302 RepID=A0ABQ4G9C7_9ACTN|nr:hypothetical protein [Microbispora corallina]GIH43642.1 putative lipoprotein [Microbispora corallina]
MSGVVRQALAAALACAALAACSGGGAAAPAPVVSPSAAAASGSAPASPSAGPQAQAVTPEEARKALDAFLATDDVVRAAGADRWTLALTRDGQRPITIAQVHSQSGRPPSYTWGGRTVLVPRQPADRATQWFAATAERRGSSGEVRTAVLAFVRNGPDGRWQNSFESLLNKGQAAPEVVVDQEGYATALDTRDTSVAITPSLMGPLHATVAEEGSEGYASSLIAPGPQTTGYADAIKRERARVKGADCMTYESIFAFVPTYPVFALRTDDGGALVLYTLTRTSSWSTDQGLKCGEGRPVPIPAAASWLLGKDDVHIEQRRQIVETQQYVGEVPSKASTAPARIIGYEGVVTGASNR